MKHILVKSTRVCNAYEPRSLGAREPASFISRATSTRPDVDKTVFLSTLYHRSISGSSFPIEAWALTNRTMASWCSPTVFSIRKTNGRTNDRFLTYPNGTKDTFHENTKFLHAKHTGRLSHRPVEWPGDPNQLPTRLQRLKHLLINYWEAGRHVHAHSL